ncbi:kinesin light chain [Xylariaceae sp. FL0255]|nr:kinesin light chain [Xylariaceae sp. FL0255]
MRLLHRDDAGYYSLTPDLAPRDAPPYAILSHTWGPDEVFFPDLAETSKRWQQKAGYRKIEFCAEQAKQDNLQHFWVDTCCIDKGSSAELQTAISSMFRWYQNAEICYAYLSDVSKTGTSRAAEDADTTWETAFRNSRWHSRGWTMQELLAPRTVEFYSREGTLLGDKRSLEPQLREITGIPASALRGTVPLCDFTVAEREAWARHRQTTLDEDLVYCLQGLFDVHMPLIYGEGQQKAQERLREEVRKATKGTRHADFSVTFSLFDAPEIQHFVARKDELTKIREILRFDGNRRVAIVHGLGGVGKTQTAIEYAKHYKDEYSAVFWLNINDEASVHQSFGKVAKLILRQYPDARYLSSLDPEKDDHKKISDAVKAWLSLSNNSRWLLIYDNFDNPKLNSEDEGIDIHQFLPEAHQGSIIVTTRSSQVDLGHRIQIKKLESLDDSLRILAKVSNRNDATTDACAKELAEELDGLPLALATAGAYLRNTSTSFSDYLRFYKQSWERLHENTPKLGSYKDRTLCSTWDLSYVQIQKQDPLAAQLLQFWAYFNNEDIWSELFQPSENNLRGIYEYAGGAANENGPAWVFELADDITFHRTMSTLQSCGFVDPHTSTWEQIGPRGYSIHACVHAWTTSVLNKNPDEGNKLARAAAGYIVAQTLGEDHLQSWLIHRRLLSHGMKCIAQISITNNDDDMGRVFNNLGCILGQQGKLIEAEVMCHRALRANEKELGPEDVTTLKTVFNLGLTYHRQGRLAEAEEMYHRVLRGTEKLLEPEHILTLDTVHNLGLLYEAQGRSAEAEELYQRALQGTENLLGAEHPSTLQTLQNLGLLYDSQGKSVKAEEMFQRALRGYEKTIGPRDIVRYEPAITALWNLGILYWDQGKLDEVEPLLRLCCASINRCNASAKSTTLSQLRMTTLLQLQTRTPHQPRITVTHRL